MFFKIGTLKNSEIFTGKHLRWSLFLILIKLQVLYLLKIVRKSKVFWCFQWDIEPTEVFRGYRTCNFNKKRLQQIFPCEICEIFTNTYFYRTPRKSQIIADILYNISQQVCCSRQKEIVCDILFLRFFVLDSSWYKITPLTVSLVQVIYNKCHLRHLFTTCNMLRLCTTEKESNALTKV